MDTIHTKILEIIKENIPLVPPAASSSIQSKVCDSPSRNVTHKDYSIATPTPENYGSMRIKGPVPSTEVFVDKGKSNSGQPTVSAFLTKCREETQTVNKVIETPSHYSICPSILDSESKRSSKIVEKEPFQPIKQANPMTQGKFCLLIENVSKRRQLEAFEMIKSAAKSPGTIHRNHNEHHHNNYPHVRVNIGTMKHREAHSHDKGEMWVYKPTKGTSDVNSFKHRMVSKYCKQDTPDRKECIMQASQFTLDDSKKFRSHTDHKECCCCHHHRHNYSPILMKTYQTAFNHSRDCPSLYPTAVNRIFDTEKSENEVYGYEAQLRRDSRSPSSNVVQSTINYFKQLARDFSTNLVQSQVPLTLGSVKSSYADDIGKISTTTQIQRTLMGPLHSSSKKHGTSFRRSSNNAIRDIFKYSEKRIFKTKKEEPRKHTLDKSKTRNSRNDSRKSRKTNTSSKKSLAPKGSEVHLTSASKLWRPGNLSQGLAGHSGDPHLIVSGLERPSTVFTLKSTQLAHSQSPESKKLERRSAGKSIKKVTERMSFHNRKPMHFK